MIASDWGMTSIHPFSSISLPFPTSWIQKRRGKQHANGSISASEIHLSAVFLFVNQQSQQPACCFVGGGGSIWCAAQAPKVLEQPPIEPKLDPSPGPRSLQQSLGLQDKNRQQFPSDPQSTHHKKQLVRRAQIKESSKQAIIFTFKFHFQVFHSKT